jgi:hypothetical protein
MFSKLKQFKDLRDKAKQLQSTLSQEKVNGSGGWGKVKLTMDGNLSVLSLDIDPSLLTPDSKSKLEAAVKEALSDAIKRAQQKAAAKLKESGDFKLPGLS